MTIRLSEYELFITAGRALLVIWPTMPPRDRSRAAAVYIRALRHASDAMTLEELEHIDREVVDELAARGLALAREMGKMWGERN